ncbi:MAG: hypothetical protein KKG10_19275 [Proteobacteria bacterium]|nr:hypothetical protein [Pseudomonadota bacterium]
MYLTNVTKVALACIVFFLVTKTGYAMQPPPPPLNLTQLGRLISEADLIAVGKVGRVKEIEAVNGKETEKTLEVILEIEKLLKGEVSGKAIVIKEVYTSSDSPTPGPMPRDENAPKNSIIGLRAGPSCYHGRYKQGDRVIIFLAKVAGIGKYRPLGSGTYDKHLCEFLIEYDGIKTFYFSFAADLVQYVGSEEKFIGLIRSLIDSNSEKRDE